MRNRPAGQVRGGVEQVLHQAKILLLALHARAEFSGAGFFKLTPKIVTALQPLFAPGETRVAMRSAAASARADAKRADQCGGVRQRKRARPGW